MFKSDGCTLFPDLWIEKCCIAHDLADYEKVNDTIADTEFFQCIVEASGGGLFGIMFAGIVVCGVMVGRPAWRWYKRNFKK